MKKTYLNACTSSYECNDSLGLTCPLITGTCNCPNASSSIFCDCIRQPNNEYYWNGTSCYPSKSINESCIGSFMCQTITQGAICNGSCTTFTCQCPFLQYFDITLNKCQHQLSFNQTCSMNNMCRFDFGLVCISGYCR